VHPRHNRRVLDVQEVGRSGVSMGSRKKIKCAGCGKRIRAHEPDLVLKNLVDDGGRPRYYPVCGTAAYGAAAEKPSAYLLTVRHVSGWSARDLHQGCIADALGRGRRCRRSVMPISAVTEREKMPRRWAARAPQRGRSQS
jgi:hypothetical protein